MFNTHLHLPHVCVFEFLVLMTPQSKITKSHCGAEAAWGNIIRKTLKILIRSPKD
jgi:hypothetical protein